MSNSLGDFAVSTVVYGKFTTFRPSTGAAYTLAGTPALSVYKDNSTTQSTTGVTLTADFDSVTGLNHFAIDTSADGTFYAAGSFFDIVITTGTVDSVSVVGSVVASFTIRKTSTGLTTADFTTTQKASINTEALDVLVTDTHAEPAAVPAATASLKDKIGWMAIQARNKITQTATTQLVKADDGTTTVGTSTVSDDATTFTRGEFA